MDDKLKHEAIRRFPPKTKFISMFGDKDVVNDKDSFKFDNRGDIYVLGANEYRLIYDGNWADIYQ